MDSAKYVIVVGIDYTTASDRALHEAFALARGRYGAQLHVANVRSSVATQTSSAGAPSPLPPWAQWATELREYVAHIASAFEAEDGAAPFQQLYTHQRMNDPARELVALAAEVHADLLVVGAHDWHEASSTTLGSVAAAVSRLAACPVLVVHSPSANETTSPAGATTTTTTV